MHGSEKFNAVSSVWLFYADSIKRRQIVIVTSNREHRMWQMIIVSWLPPPVPECNGPIVGYRMRYKAKGRGQSRTLNLEGNVRSYSLTGSNV